jgi:hypothetical protein
MDLGVIMGMIALADAHAMRLLAFVAAKSGGDGRLFARCTERALAWRDILA